EADLPVVTEDEWAELSQEDDPEIMSERAELKARRRSRSVVGRGFSPGNAPTLKGRPTPAELFASWPDVDARLASATQLAQLGLVDESRIPNPESRVRCQPAV